MKRILRAIVFLLCCGPLSLFATGETLSEEEQQYLAAIFQLWESVDRQQGKIKLPNAVAVLDIPENFYYIDAAGAETLLVDIWGNPPGSGSATLGMILPANSSPLEDSFWGVSIEYEEDGYVSDEDADQIDYDDLLVEMQEGIAEASKQRVQQGYDSMRLVGWAAKPYYDSAAHKLHWAKELEFGGSGINTLNYDIRVLGRKGVLVLSFIASMDQKPVIDANIDTVLQLAEFDQGHRYEDFNPDIDKVAAYGLGTLVAGKVLAKTGMLAAALLFLKKFGVIILVGFGAVASRLFKKKPAEQV